MDVSENSGTPKSSILIGFSIINHPFRGTTIFGNTQITSIWWVMYSRWFLRMACEDKLTLSITRFTPQNSWVSSRFIHHRLVFLRSSCLPFVVVSFFFWGGKHSEGLVFKLQSQAILRNPGSFLSESQLDIFFAPTKAPEKNPRKLTHHIVAETGFRVFLVFFVLLGGETSHIFGIFTYRNLGKI